MSTINAILSPSCALSLTSPHTALTPTPSIEKIFAKALKKEEDFKRFALFLALNGLSGEERLAEEKRLSEKHRLSGIDLPHKHLEMPPEIIEQLFYRTLLNLKPHEIVRVTQVNGQLVRENWLALYQQFDWLYPEIVSTLSEFKTLVEDARTYGQKTFEQIFSGFHLLKRIKENPNALAKMTIADLQQTGIYTDIWKYPPHESTREIAPQNFLRWIQANPACILVCLRWAPARNFAPDLLVEAANHGNLVIVKTVFAFIKEHHITDFNAERALRDAIIKAYIPIADYLVSEEVKARVRWLPEDILHQAVIINPSFENIEWLVENGVLLNHIGSDRLNSQDYGKTAADIAISRLILWNFVSSSAEFRKNEMDRLHIALYLIDKGVPFNTQYKPKYMTLLHAACYAEDIDLGLRVARLVIEQDPGCIHTPIQDRNAFTPLHLAFLEKHYLMMELLLENGADATVPLQGNAISNKRAKKETVMEPAHQLGDLEAQVVLQRTGNTGFISRYNFDWLHPEWVSTWEEFQALIDDAGKYGQRTLKQIFEGFNVLRLMKLAGSHAPITMAHLQRAGIVQKGHLYPDDIEASERAQNAFVDWIRANPAHMLACLRWMPVQRDIPDLLIEAVKLKEVARVQSVLEFMRKHDITPLHTEKALEQAVKNADFPITHYLLREAGIHSLPLDIPHIAAETGCLEIVQLLMNQGVLLDSIGRDNRNSYLGKTAAEVAVSAITASLFAPHASKALRDKGINLLNTACYLLQAGQAHKTPFDQDCTPTGMSLLHAACYASSEQEGLWLAQWAFNQDPTCIRELDNEGHTPLYRAVQQKRPLLINFLISKDARITLTPWAYYVALRFQDPQTFRVLQNKKEAVSIHIMHPSIIPTLNFNYILNRIRGHIDGYFLLSVKGFFSALSYGLSFFFSKVFSLFSKSTLD